MMISIGLIVERASDKSAAITRMIELDYSDPAAVRRFVAASGSFDEPVETGAELSWRTFIRCTHAAALLRYKRNESNRTPPCSKPCPDANAKSSKPFAD